MAFSMQAWMVDYKATVSFTNGLIHLSWFIGKDRYALEQPAGNGDNSKIIRLYLIGLWKRAMVICEREQKAAIQAGVADEVYKFMVKAKLSGWWTCESIQYHFDGLYSQEMIRQALEKDIRFEWSGECVWRVKA